MQSLNFKHCKSLKISAMAIISALFISTPVLAADIHSIPCVLDGVSSIDEEFPYGLISLYEKHFLNVPDYVVEYYSKVGGTFTFTKENLSRNENMNVLGLYYFGSRDIKIKLDPAYIISSSYLLYSAPAHEFGHFIYDITGNYWTDEMTKSLQAEYEKRIKLNSNCTDQNEAFAYAFADYVIMPWKVNPEMRKTIKTCLDVIKRLNGGGVDTWVDIYPDPSTLTAPGTVAYK